MESRETEAHRERLSTDRLAKGALYKSKFTTTTTNVKVHMAICPCTLCVNCSAVLRLRSDIFASGTNTQRAYKVCHSVRFVGCWRLPGGAMCAHSEQHEEALCLRVQQLQSIP